MKYLPEELVKSFLSWLPESQIFSVVFHKANGTERKMTCKRGVTKHLAGGKSTTDHIDSLVNVWSLDSEGYRCFDRTRVLTLKGGGVTLQVTRG